MRPIRPHTAAEPFTLVCGDCDAGMHIESQQQATVEGWDAIDYAPNLPMANHVGSCRAVLRRRVGRWLRPWNELLNMPLAGFGQRAAVGRHMETTQQ